MTRRYLTVFRTVIVSMAVAAIVIVPVTTAFAQQDVAGSRPISGLAQRDGSEFLGNTGEFGPLRRVPRSAARPRRATWPRSGSARLVPSGTI